MSIFVDKVNFSHVQYKMGKGKRVSEPDPSFIPQCRLTLADRLIRLMPHQNMSD